ncbi:MAG: stage III sporulation protein AF [Alicyclobacillus sp.]|nr:stage III sporulation protein AF [Alicyclobacillus sp.]
MTALGGWIRQLVLLVFLAIVAELLLPAQALQRYVRMVMGLAILAVMVQPFLPIVRGHWANQAADAAVREIFSVQSDTNSAIDARLGEFSNVLHAEAEATATQLAEQRLQVQIEAACHCTVRAVEILGLDGSHVQSVTVHTPSAQDPQVRQAIVSFVASTLMIAPEAVAVRG